jgi:hypothetical protein
MVYPSLTPSSSAVVPFPSIQPRPGPERVREAVRPFLHLLNADVKGFTFQAFTEKGNQDGDRKSNS